ncbi:hypothetical protein ONE63_006434 [Megalurothrips usitatus]|uniref:folate gamma-glutamyl hydrolase n=1 Tax=Megalurothrips usitatus TaxID=439358 RepID=A0AAV7XXJ1_9NEOP|nr:hypothetical protein ONE63_006434 [Megalurothrips usitatus]
MAASVTTCTAWVMLLLLCLVPVLGSEDDNEIDENNDRPIIGILSQELPEKRRPEWKKYKSFISASYVKFIESAGGRVVPIWINKTRPYYENLMNKINGVLFPGGSTDFNAQFGFADAGAIIYDIAKKLNDKGNYFPLWGTCQGFELLAYLGANHTNPLTDCKSFNVDLALEFLPVYKKSKLFGSAPSDVLELLSSKPVTTNFHRFCLTQENVTRFMGDINWRLISLNNDSDGLTYVSSMESRTYPTYGVQFHPEKNIFEWSPIQKTAHSFDSIRTSQYFANFFVNEARKNYNSFSSEDDEDDALIYNFNPVYSGKKIQKKYGFNEQVYLFEW